MERKAFTIQDVAGNAIRGASVLIKTYPGGVTATLYADDEVTPITNPMTTNAKGQCFGKALNGHYTQVSSKTGVMTETETDIVFFDPDDLTDQYAAPDGSSRIGHIASGEGAVATTDGQKQRERVTPQDFMLDALREDVAAGTRLIDASVAIQSAINTGKPVEFLNGPGWAYKIGQTVSIPSNTVLIGNNATLVLASGVNGDIFRIADGAFNVHVSNLQLNGMKASNTSGNGIGTGASSSDNIRVERNTIVDCADHGIYIRESFNAFVDGNYVTGCGYGGVTLGDTVNQFSLTDNHAWLNGTHGVGILGIGKHGLISANVCWDNGQGTPSADNLTGYNASNEDISITGNVSKGGLNNGIHFGGSHITYSGNTVYDAAQNGLYHSPNVGTCNNVSITGNTVYSAGLQGIRVLNTINGSITGNVTASNATAGLGLDSCSDFSIVGNCIKSNTGEGIVFGATNTRLTISANEVVSNGSAGIAIASVTFACISGNTISSNAGVAILGGGAEGNNIICNNTMRSNVGGASMLFANNTKVFGNDSNLGTAFPVATPSDQQGLAIQNTSTAATRFWSWRPVTNGTETDIYIRENGATPTDRGRYVAGGRKEWFGDFAVTTAGKGLCVKEGSNAKQGVATLVGGTVTVANTSVTTTSRIQLTGNADGGTPGWVRVSSRVAGTSFTITSSSGTDTSTVAYQIFEPA